MTLKSFLLLISLSPSALIAAQDYCSLIVRVSAPDGRRPEVEVSVVEKNGRVQEQDQGKSDLRFCDLGGLPVTVKVGADGTCNQVIVREVPVAWEEPYFLSVLYDSVPCLLDLPRSPIPTCRIVFRVKDRTGQWAAGARINIAEPITRELTTDRFGRSSLLIKLGDNLAGNATNQEATATFKYRCSLRDSVHEVGLSLQKP